MKLPKISDRVGAVFGYGFLIVTAPVTIPAVAMLFALFGIVWAKRRVIGPSKNWRPWFAWYPVNVGDWFDSDWRWLEIVQRQSWSLLGDTNFAAPDTPKPPAQE